MSLWFEPKEKDLSISLDGKDLYIFLEQDDNGSVYASINIETLKTFLNSMFVAEEIEKAKTLPNKK